MLSNGLQKEGQHQMATFVGSVCRLIGDGVSLADLPSLPIPSNATVDRVEFLTFHKSSRLRFVSCHDRSLAAAVIHGRGETRPPAEPRTRERERGGANEMSTTTPSPSLARSRRRRIECLPFSEMAEQRERGNKCQHQMEQKRFGEELLRKRLILCLSVRELQWRVDGRAAV